MRMNIRDLTIIVILTIGIITIAGCLYVLSYGISTDHINMGTYDKIEGYPKLYKFDQTGFNEIEPSSVLNEDYVLLGNQWLENNPKDVSKYLQKWAAMSVTMIVLNSESATFDTLDDSYPTEFEPSAQIHALYISNDVTFCLSLTCQDNWTGHVMNPEWRTTDKAYIVSKSQTPCCISTTEYQNDSGIHFISTNMYWKHEGQYMPVAIWHDGESEPEWITPERGFFMANMFQFISQKYAMETMDFKTTTDGRLRYDYVANVHFYDDRYSYSMPVGNTVVSWSIPSENTGPYYSNVDCGGKYDDGYWEQTQYKFIIDKANGHSGSFIISSGGSFELLDNTYSEYAGIIHTSMKYQNDLNRYVFDLQNEFNIPIVKNDITGDS